MNKSILQRIPKDLDKVLSFESIVSPVNVYLKNLDDYLLLQVDSLEPEVQEQVNYVLSHSGKRLRPILVAYSGLQEGFESNQDLIRLGAILELVHLATLVHDDILDEATVRHGTPTVAAKYGKDAARALKNTKKPFYFNEYSWRRTYHCFCFFSKYRPRSSL